MYLATIITLSSKHGTKGHNMKTQHIETEFRAQLSTDRIVSVEERYNDNDGAYQIAHGFDVNGNAIKLCNRGFASIPNYISETAKRRFTLQRLAMKRQRQYEQASAAGNIRVRVIARHHKQLILETLKTF